MLCNILGKVHNRCLMKRRLSCTLFYFPKDSPDGFCWDKVLEVLELTLNLATGPYTLHRIAKITD